MGFANALFAAWNDGADAPLRSRLSAAIASARAIWPGVELPDDAFLRHLGDRLDHPGAERRGMEPSPALLEAIESTHTDDLWLACACARGDDTALQHFDRFALAPAVAALLDADMAKDEVMQQLRVRLLVRDGDTPPRIEQYGGRGSLRAWTRIAVLRAIKDDRRARARRGHAHDLAEDLLRDPAAMADPEMDRVRASYGAEFRAAFAIAVARLPADARRLLRQHHLHGLTLDALARIHGIHRVTAARRLAKARADLLADTRRELVRRLHVDRGELDRAVGLIMSRLELSLERMLASRDDL